MLLSQMEDVTVTAIRTTPYTAVQVGVTDRPEKNVHNALMGQFRKNNVTPKLRLAEFKVSDDALLKPGMLQLLAVLPCLIYRYRH